MNNKARKPTIPKEDSHREFLYVSTPIHTSSPSLAADYIWLWMGRIKRSSGARYVFIGLIAFLLIGGMVYVFVGFLNTSVRNTKTDLASTTMLDPYDLLRTIAKDSDTYALFDLRSPEAYANGHIVRAQNVSSNKAELLRHAASVKGRTIVLYSHSQFAQDLYPAHQILSENGYSSRVLAIGWNEWAHMNTLWIPDDQWSKYNISDYIQESSIEDAAL